MSVRDYVAAIKAEYRRERELRAALKAEARARGARFCAARERLRVQLWRSVLWPFRPCQRPGVEAYRTHDAAHIAAVAIMRHAKRPTYALPRKCRCGYWHLEVAHAKTEAEWEGDE